MAAEGMAAPAESTTVPKIAPVLATCALRGDIETASKQTPRKEEVNARAAGSGSVYEAQLLQRGRRLVAFKFGQRHLLAAVFECYTCGRIHERECLSQNRQVLGDPGLKPVSCRK